MTREEAKQKYGEVSCQFSSYYKYRFTFSGTAPDGAIVMFSIGGDSSDIYKLSISVSNPETISGNDFDNDLSFRIKNGDKVTYFDALD